MPFCHVRLRGSRPASPAYPKVLATIGDHLRKRRLDLGLLQREVAKRLDVTESTVTNWELNRTAAALRFIPRIIGLLGYLPFPPDSASPFPVRLRAHREMLGLSQKALALLLDVDEVTVAGWERGRRRPGGELLHRLEVLVGPLAP